MSQESACGAAAGTATHVIDVRTPSKSYQVHVGCGTFDHMGELVRAACGGERCFLASDHTVAGLYGQRAIVQLEGAGYEVTPFSFYPGEESKTWDTLGTMLEALAAAGLTRDDCVVALGGGVVGDMAGLAAALWLRGVKVAQVPTTLLAMVDSSVGGKTAVDLPAGKNLVGAFLQPSVVVADPECLTTVEPDLFRDSCGEVIKHAVLADENLFDQLLQQPLTGEDVTTAQLAAIVARNVQIKRDVVDADEHEHGLRQTLNLGHTIGHAIEAAHGYQMGHGTCVATGLCCIAWASARLGWCSQATAEAIDRVVAAHGLPTDTDLDHEVLVRFAAHDKKRHGDAINVVVPLAIGQVEVRTLTMPEFTRVVNLGCGRGEGGARA